MLPHLIIALDFGTECESPTSIFFYFFRGEQSWLHLVLSSADQALVPGTCSHQGSVFHSLGKRTTTIRGPYDEMAGNLQRSAANCRHQDGQLLAIWDDCHLGRTGYVLQVNLHVIQAGPAQRQIPDICPW